MNKNHVTILLSLCLATVLFSQVTWTSRTSGTRNEIRSVAYGSNLYVAVGVSDSNSGAFFTSPDGISWTVRFSPINPSSAKPIGVIGIAYGNGQYVAVGTEGGICTSPDGTTWTLITKVSSAYSLYRITYGNSQFVAVGWGPAGGVIYTSPNGTTWTSRTSGTTNGLNDVIYGNNLYVAVGSKSTILTSPDAVTWTNRTFAADSAYIFYGVTYGNNQYVVVGNGTTISTSPDGVAWTKRTTPYQILYSVAYGNGRYVLAGGAGYLYTSPDAITWTFRTSGLTTSAILDEIIFGNNQFLAVGIPGAIITSPIATHVLHAAPKLNYSVRGEVLQIYSLQGKFIAQKKIGTENYCNGKSSLYKNLSMGTYIVRIPSNNAFISRENLLSSFIFP